MLKGCFLVSRVLKWFRMWKFLFLTKKNRAKSGLDSLCPDMGWGCGCLCDCIDLTRSYGYWLEGFFLGLGRNVIEFTVF